MRLDLEEMEAGLLEAAVAAGMAGGKGWCTGVVEVLKSYIKILYFKHDTLKFLTLEGKKIRKIAL